jgi:hypothetical protein
MTDLYLFLLGLYIVLVIFLLLLPYLVDEIAELLRIKKFNNLYKLFTILLPLTIVFSIAILIGFAIIFILAEYKDKKEGEELLKKKNR